LYISFVTAYVPQGLPVCVALTLTLIARRMARKNVLVKTLPTVETLGAVDLLLSDKTGTLTENKMSVVRVYFDFNVVSDHREIHRMYDEKNPVLRLLAENSVLCNHAFFQGQKNYADHKHEEDLLSSTEHEVDSEYSHSIKIAIQDRKIIGDATDSAMLRWVEDLTNVHQLRQTQHKFGEVPFSSKTKWHLTLLHPLEDSETSKLILKGAPEIILKYCTTVLTGDGEIKLTKKLKKKILAQQNEFAENAERVLAIVEATFKTKNFKQKLENMNFEKLDESDFDTGGLPLKNLCFLGLVSLMDPPRSDVKETINILHTAGIRVAMVTGDHWVTGVAIAKAIGIFQKGTKLIHTADLPPVPKNLETVTKKKDNCCNSF